MDRSNSAFSSTTLIFGGSRGLGLGIAHCLAEDEGRVVVVGRHREALDDATQEHPGLEGQIGDASDARFVSSLIADLRPDRLLLVAGAVPRMSPIAEYDWEDFCAAWELDVKMTFVALKSALVLPLRPGARVLVVSSGAALHGSPLSGGYAGAKQTQRFLADYARGEARERKLGLTVQTLLPQLNPNTRLGRAGIAGYAAKAGLTPEEFAAKRFPEPLTPAIAGSSVRRLLSEDPGRTEQYDEYLLTGQGLRPLPRGA